VQNREERGYWEDRELTRSVLVWSEGLGEASVDGERRRWVVTGADLMSQFDVFVASRHARVDEEVAGDEAKLQGFTAVLERTPNGGD
jgi:hypothetical protein